MYIWCIPESALSQFCCITLIVSHGDVIVYCQEVTMLQPERHNFLDHLSGVGLCGDSRATPKCRIIIIATFNHNFEVKYQEVVH